MDSQTPISSGLRSLLWYGLTSLPITFDSLYFLFSFPFIFLLFLILIRLLLSSTVSFT